MYRDIVCCIEALKEFLICCIDTTFFASRHGLSHRGIISCFETSVKVNVLEYGESFKKNTKLAPKGKSFKKKHQPKFQRKCFECEVGHKPADCPRKGKEVNLTEVDDDFLVAMIFELNKVGLNDRSWSLDTGATHHICCVESAFSTLDKIQIWCIWAIQICLKWKGILFLKFTIGKTV